MPRGKKNSTTPSTTAKNASKTVAEPIQEKAVVSETKNAKPTAKKKAAAPKKAPTAKTRTTKKTVTSVTTVETGVLKSAVIENAEKAAKKSTAKTAKKAAPNTTKNTAKKTSATATGSKKPAVKKTAKGKSDEVLIQSSGKDYTLAEITETCKNAYRGGTRKQIKSIKVYVKAEGNQLKAYYVVNGSISGAVDL